MISNVAIRTEVEDKVSTPAIIVYNFFKSYGFENAEEIALEMEKMFSKWSKWMIDENHKREIRWKIIGYLLKAEKEPIKATKQILAREKEIINALKEATDGKN